MIGEEAKKPGKRRWMRCCGCVGAAALVFVMGAALLGLTLARKYGAGVLVSVRNTGSATQKDVRVATFEREWRLGDLEPGEGRFVRVGAKGETNVTVTSESCRSSEEIYLEPGTLGALRWQLDGNSIECINDWSF